MKNYIRILDLARLRKLKNERISSSFFAVLLLIFSIGCTKEDVEPIFNPTPVTAVKLNKAIVTLSAGETEELTVIIIPENATNKTVWWTSSNVGVATVTNGKVTAVAAGMAIISAQVGNLKAECSVTVRPTEVTSITLNKTSVTLSVGETEKLTTIITPENATDKTIKWTSSNASVATVTNGKVIAVAAGSATITAWAGNVKAECSVTVLPIEVTSITLNRTSVTLSEGETVELIAITTPENVTDKTVKWTSSNTSVVTVTDGKVTAVAAGSATITAQAGNVTAECSVTVRPTEVTSITLNETSITLSVGETIELIAIITPENATDKTVMWTSSNTSVATVTNGKVTVVAAGSTTITAQSNNGYSDTCHIVVVSKPDAGGSEGTGEVEW